MPTLMVLVSVSGLVLVDQILSKPLIFTLLDMKHKISISLTNFAAATSQALITFCLWYSFKAHMDEASKYANYPLLTRTQAPLSFITLNVSTPQPIFQRLSVIVVIRGTLLAASHLGLVILYLARPDRLWWTPMHQSHVALYYMTAITTLNIRDTGTLRVQEDPEAAKDYRVNGAIDPFLLVIAPRDFAEADSFLNCIEDTRRPSPVLDLYSVGSTRSEKAAGVRGNLSIGQRDGMKEIRAESRPNQDELGVVSPPEKESFSCPPPLMLNRVNEGGSMSSFRSLSSKGKGREIDSLGERTSVGDIHPRLIRQLPKVPAKR
ncbi:hypothetical protein PQX77_017370 [Marasmius sp. AFHP31]|nr:hypothetical protein PQX77_017370 [Marasmius sp. AFHP31]